MGSQADALEAESRWAESQMAAGDAAGALGLVEIALRHAHAMDGLAPQIPLLHRVRGAALASLGDDPGAVAELRRSLEVARIRRVEFDEALTLRLMAQLGIDYEGQSAAALGQESTRIFESLGVVDAFDLAPELARTSVADDEPLPA